MKNPPSHLSSDAKQLWLRLVEEFDLSDAAAYALLRSLCEAFDRAEQARRQIARDGLFITDRFGQTKSHPACVVERDARSQVLAAVRALKLAPEAIE